MTTIFSLFSLMFREEGFFEDPMRKMATQTFKSPHLFLSLYYYSVFFPPRNDRLRGSNNVVYSSKVSVCVVSNLDEYDVGQSVRAQTKQTRVLQARVSVKLDFFSLSPPKFLPRESEKSVRRRDVICVFVRQGGGQNLSFFSSLHPPPSKNKTHTHTPKKTQNYRFHELIQQMAVKQRTPRA